MSEINNNHFEKKVFITYALLLGTNMGNKSKNLDFALKELLKRDFKVLKKSSIYQTPAWGMEGEDFLNQALLVQSYLKPLDVLIECLTIERALGRVRNPNAIGYESRVLDVDILHAGGFVSQYEVLELPHPRLSLRRFAMTPLVEIDPDWRHPILQKSAIELLDICPDESLLTQVTDH